MVDVEHQVNATGFEVIEHLHELVLALETLGSDEDDMGILEFKWSALGNLHKLIHCPEKVRAAENLGICH